MPQASVVILACFAIFFLYRGYTRGLIAILTMFVGWMLGGAMALMFAPAFAEAYLGRLPLSIMIKQVLASFVLFFGTALVVNLTVGLIRVIIPRKDVSMLSRNDPLWGAAFNGVLGLCLGVVAVWGYGQAHQHFNDRPSGEPLVAFANATVGRYVASALNWPGAGSTGAGRAGPQINEILANNPSAAFASDYDRILSNPQVQQLFSLPAMRQALQNGNLQQLSGNPNFQQIVQNPQLGGMLQDLQRLNQNTGSDRNAALMGHLQNAMASLKNHPSMNRVMKNPQMRQMFENPSAGLSFISPDQSSGITNALTGEDTDLYRQRSRVGGGKGAATNDVVAVNLKRRSEALTQPPTPQGQPERLMSTGEVDADAIYIWTDEDGKSQISDEQPEDWQ